MAMTHSLISYPPSSKLQPFCCLPKNPSSLPPPPPPPPQLRRTDGARNRLQQRKEIETKKQPSIEEIERAIGAGVFRDSSDNNNRDSEDGNSLFDSIVSNSIGKSEGSVERKIRETGEWLVRRSEKRSNSEGKNILKVLFLLVLPIWMVSFLVVSGSVKLPFGSTYLEDLMM
ncbi:probable NAD(P)H dehydrogenase subunit CRR3, chloroplastic [Impatiens glandulifera]|uniref:probable NAD(P)H dehydrogenase subunit CRR3, chloroplastic n=1 Tax=Impatiens glandulifera TaxID=253017 RepID=UPI001FB09E12|nr:probable NAD(P)H dehydrogenase subunit CRR3, chloroplastic [Impatiens glandulifera]